MVFGVLERYFVVDVNEAGHLKFHDASIVDSYCVSNLLWLELKLGFAISVIVIPYIVSVGLQISN